MTLADGVIIAIVVVVGLLAILVFGLLRSHADILRRLESIGAGTDLGPEGHAHENELRLNVGAKPGRATPDLVGIDPSGDPVAISTEVGVDPLLIAFLSTTCSSCSVFWENLDGSERYFGGRKHRVVIATLGADEESPSRAASLRKGSADVVMTSQGWEDFEVPGAPYFVMVDPGKGVIGEGSAMTFSALEEFLADSENDQTWDRKRAAKSNADAEREHRIDRELRDAGIEPGDPRLYPDPDSVDGSS